MFCDCKSLKYINLNNFNESAIYDDGDYYDDIFIIFKKMLLYT